MDPSREELKNIMLKYRRKVESELGENEEDKKLQHLRSVEYKAFKETFMPKQASWYEKACNMSESVLKITPDEKKAAELQESIDMCHLNVTPTGVVSFSLLVPIILAFFGSALAFALISDFFFVFLFFLIAIIMVGPLGRIPVFLGNSWRMQASNQMVICVFYVATYMRHSPNLENAIWFASEHLTPPLSLDLKKVLWDVETERYESVKASLEIYLSTWKKYNLEFVESFHLIEASLYEGSEDRRIQTLDKALDLILTETYEKMIHYAHNLKSPITTLHMLGIILPILGLVILPLVVSFMAEVQWYHLMLIYNFFLPVLVYYMARNILSMRPTGYGDSDMSDDEHKKKKYENVLIHVGKSEIQIHPLYFAVSIFLVLFTIGISPMLLHMLGMPDFGLSGMPDETSPCGDVFCMLGYIDKSTGPYGLGATMLSFVVTLGIGSSVGIFYKLRSSNVIKVRERAKKLEDEFANAIFQLGNRLGDGIPAEMAVGKVGELMRGTTSGDFFQLVDSNVKRLGMSVRQAIFDPQYGALKFYPSRIIQSSMKVLVESIRKGPDVAAQALINISRYIKEIHKVNERLRDLMAEIISSMESQVKFLTPAIAGIVVGITAMISTVIRKLNAFGTGGPGGESGMGASSLDFSPGVPTFYFQVMVGLYVIQIVYILSILSNGIQNGSDKSSERFILGRNIMKSTVIYTILAMVITLIFNIIAGNIMSGMSAN